MQILLKEDLKPWEKHMAKRDLITKQMPQFFFTISELCCYLNYYEIYRCNIKCYQTNIITNLLNRKYQYYYYILCSFMYTWIQFVHVSTLATVAWSACWRQNTSMPDLCW